MGERVRIEQGEWYPVCSIEGSGDNGYADFVVDVPDGFTARWEAAYAEFEACQEVMHKLIATEPDPVPLPEPGDSILECDDGAVNFKAGDVVMLGDDDVRMLVVSIAGGSVRMRPWVPA